MRTGIKWALIFLTIGSICYVSVHYLAHTHYSQRCLYRADACSSCIIESSSISDLLEQTTDANTLFVFDLDNTLIQPVGQVGSDQWFSYLFKQKMSNGTSRAEALAELLPLFYRVHDYIAMQPVEPCSLQVLDALKKKGFPLVVLTTRSLPLIQRTCEQLKDLGFSFTDSPHINQELTIPLEKPAVLHNGIIFCNDNNKGLTLLKTLELCTYKPSVIVFMDDKVQNLLDVEKECLLNHIRFIGIRYGKVDARVAQFDPVRAEHELASLLEAHTSGNPVPA